MAASCRWMESKPNSMKKELVAKLPESSKTSTEWPPSPDMGMNTWLVKRPSLLVRLVLTSTPPTRMKTLMSGWKLNPWRVTSWPPGPAEGLRKMSGLATDLRRANPIFWFGPPYSPSRESAQTMYTSSSVALMAK